ITAISGKVNVDLSAARDIVVTADITTNGGDITLRARANDGAEGRVQISNATLSTGGGAITIGGGSGSRGFAVGRSAVTIDAVSYVGGVILNGATLDAGGGEIALRGQSDSTDPSANAGGVLFLGTNSIATSGTGTILVDGQVSNSVGGTGAGLLVLTGSTVIEATGTGQVNVLYKSAFRGTPAGEMRPDTALRVSSNGGAVSLGGIGENDFEMGAGAVLNLGVDGDGVATAGSVMFAGENLTVNAGSTIAATGAVVINATASFFLGGAITAGGGIFISASDFGQAGTASLTMTGNGNTLTISADSLGLNGAAGSIAATGTSGVNYAYLRPLTAGTAIGLGTGSGTLSISSAELGTLSGFEVIVVGTRSSGNLTLGGTVTAPTSIELFGPTVQQNADGVLNVAGAGSYLSIYADTLDLRGVAGSIKATTSGTNTVQFYSRTNDGRSIGVGTGAGSVQIGAAALGRLDGFETIVVGDAPGTRFVQYGAVDIGGALSLPGITLRANGTTVTVSGTLSAASVVLQALANVSVSNATITTTATTGDAITIRARADDAVAGQVIVTLSTLTAAGGDIRIGGGSDGEGYAVSDLISGTNAERAGVYIAGSTLSANGSAVIRGAYRGVNAYSVTTAGVAFEGTVDITAGDTVLVTGHYDTRGVASNSGIHFYSGGSTQLLGGDGGVILLGRSRGGWSIGRESGAVAFLGTTASGSPVIITAEWTGEPGTYPATFSLQNGPGQWVIGRTRAGTAAEPGAVTFVADRLLIDDGSLLVHTSGTLALRTWDTGRAIKVQPDGSDDFLFLKPAWFASGGPFAAVGSVIIGDTAATGDIEVLSSLAFANGPLTLLTGGDVLVTGGLTATGIVIRSDADGSGSGNVRILDATVTATDGQIRIGGGTTDDGFAVGDGIALDVSEDETYAGGVTLRNATIAASGGDVAIRGRVVATGGAKLGGGVILSGDTSISASGSGSILVVGLQGATSYAGVTHLGGILAWGRNAPVIETSGGGSVELRFASVDTDKAGLLVAGSTSLRVNAAGRPVSLLGEAPSKGWVQWNLNAKSGSMLRVGVDADGNTSATDVTLGINANWSFGSVEIAGSGTLTIRPLDPAAGLDLGDGFKPGTLLSSAILRDGFAQIVAGDADMTGDIAVSTLISVNDPLVLRTKGAIRVNNGVVTSGGDLTLEAGAVDGVVLGLGGSLRIAGDATLTLKADRLQRTAGSGIVVDTLSGFGQILLTPVSVATVVVDAAFSAAISSNLVADETAITLTGVDAVDVAAGSTLDRGAWANALDLTLASGYRFTNAGTGTVRMRGRTIRQSSGATIDFGAGTLELHAAILNLQGPAGSITGSGTLRLMPHDADGAIRVGTGGATDALSVFDPATLAKFGDAGTLAIGSTSMSGAVTIAGTVSRTGAVAVFGHAVTVSGTIRSGTSVTLNALTDIVVDGGEMGALGDGPVPVTLTAGRGDNWTGQIVLSGGALIQTKGGDVRLGGDGTRALPGSAVTLDGVEGTVAAGVIVSASTIDAGTGDIEIRGRTHAGMAIGTNRAGIFFDRADIRTSGSGTIFLDGVNGDASGTLAAAILVGGTGASAIRAGSAGSVRFDIAAGFGISGLAVLPGATLAFAGGAGVTLRSFQFATHVGTDLSVIGAVTVADGAAMTLSAIRDLRLTDATITASGASEFTLSARASHASAGRVLLDGSTLASGGGAIRIGGGNGAEDFAVSRATSGREAFGVLVADTAIDAGTGIVRISGRHAGFGNLATMSGVMLRGATSVAGGGVWITGDFDAGAGSQFFAGVHIGPGTVTMTASASYISLLGMSDVGAGIGVLSGGRLRLSGTNGASVRLDAGPGRGVLKIMAGGELSVLSAGNVTIWANAIDRSGTFSLDGGGVLTFTTRDEARPIVVGTEDGDTLRLAPSWFSGAGRVVGDSFAEVVIGDAYGTAPVRIADTVAFDSPLSVIGPTVTVEAGAEVTVAGALSIEATAGRATIAGTIRASGGDVDVSATSEIVLPGAVEAVSGTLRTVFLRAPVVTQAPTGRVFLTGDVADLAIAADRLNLAGPAGSVSTTSATGLLSVTPFSSGRDAA
ncbi:MAG: beta strand repeat-containing protein, partial [Rhodospirillales bacterium]